ncbi:MAG TPA: hypothetical protein VG889_17730 [Rhizomicrobium sp.]|nr:hypothetical protein [Rhizomicrobium sp.]
MTMLGHLVVGRYGTEGETRTAFAAPVPPGWLRRVLALLRRH